MGLEGLGTGCRRFSKRMVRTRRDLNLDSRIRKNPVPDPEPKYPARHSVSNARGGIRTHDLQIRNLLPCPC